MARYWQSGDQLKPCTTPEFFVDKVFSNVGKEAGELHAAIAVGPLHATGQPARPEDGGGVGEAVG